MCRPPPLELPFLFPVGVRHVAGETKQQEWRKLHGAQRIQKAHMPFFRFYIPYENIVDKRERERNRFRFCERWRAFVATDRGPSMSPTTQVFKQVSQCLCVTLIQSKLSCTSDRAVTVTEWRRAFSEGGTEFHDFLLEKLTVAQQTNNTRTFYNNLTVREG
jgi:hypothetical protein